MIKILIVLFFLIFVVPGVLAFMALLVDVFIVGSRVLLVTFVPLALFVSLFFGFIGPGQFAAIVMILLLGFVCLEWYQEHQKKKEDLENDSKDTEVD